MSTPLVTPVTPGGTSNTRAKSEPAEPYARKGVTRGDGVTSGSTTSFSSASTVHLDSDSIEAVARRVVDLLTGTEAAGLVDAAELARRLGVSRDWVYRHADELGAVHVGDGKRARLRFDPAASLPRTSRCAGSGHSSSPPPN